LIVKNPISWLELRLRLTREHIKDCINGFSKQLG